MKQYIEKCLAREDLTAEEASAALEMIIANRATEVQIAGLLVAMRGKGETVEELVGFARVMRERCVRVEVDDTGAIDMCGTGGDGLHTFNISTVASLVVAGAGVTVAKHGNRSVSSRSGSADILNALGVNTEIPPAKAGDCINAVGLGFLFAPLHHPAMKYAAKPRAELGVRTIFNMIGPLANPAGVSRQLIGTYHPDVASRLAGALARLSTEHACVVHGGEGLDEVSVAGDTAVLEVRPPEEIRSYTVSPASFGLPVHALNSLKGGTPKDNATLALRILAGERGACRDVVIANAALGLFIGGKVQDFQEGSACAAESIDSGRAMLTLKRLAEFTNL